MVAASPPSTCISERRRPFASASISTGGNSPGMALVATRMSWKSLSAASPPADAIAPMFHATGRPESMLVVTMIRRRPRRCSAAMSARSCGVMRLAMNSRSGQVSIRLSTVLRSSKTSGALIAVKSRLRSASRAGPRKAKGASSAPELTPETTEKFGRLPVSERPFSRPAPNAESSPPADRASQGPVERPQHAAVLLLRIGPEARVGNARNDRGGLLLLREFRARGRRLRLRRRLRRDLRSACGDRLRAAFLRRLGARGACSGPAGLVGLRTGGCACARRSETEIGEGNHHRADEANGEQLRAAS